MPSSLKDKNKLPLFLVAAANLAFFYATIKNDAVFSGEWSRLFSDISEAVPVGLGLVLVSALNSFISADMKSRLIFLRWRNPLPGSRAFSRLAPRDSRVDLRHIEDIYGELPSDPGEENRLWYKIYKSVENNESVIQAHKEFLLFRDYGVLSLFMWIFMSAYSYIKMNNINEWLIYSSIMMIQFIITMRAAQTNGNRLVTTVLAERSAQSS